MSAEDAERWKEKYLNSIEQQDKLERRWNARLDLLRRGLVRSTLAAEGADRTVDQCMKEMREVVRTDDMDAPLAALLPRLEKAVLDSEQRRETRVEQIGVALSALVAQLQALPLPREVSKPLKAFAKRLDSRVAQAREIPLLLGELSALQGRALAPQTNEPAPPRPGLLQRLFGAHDTEQTDTVAHEDTLPPAPVMAVPRPSVQAPDAGQALAVEPLASAPPGRGSAPEAMAQAILAQVELPPVALVQALPVTEEPGDPDAVRGALESVVALVDTEVQRLEAVVESPQSEAQTSLEALDQTGADAYQPADPELAEVEAGYVLLETTEPSYSSVAEHIESTLLGLLSDLSLPEHHRPQAEAMRLRLEKGLNWYELLPILDDLAVLMLAVTNSGQHEFQAYLKQLNGRLESFQNNLQAATAGHAEGKSAADDLHSQLREHVDGLQHSMQGAVDLNSLKGILDGRLEGLLSTMEQHRQQRDAREHEVSALLQGLAERVVHMEEQALRYREHLEEQRQKALIDPLTGLPNRAAWGERLAQEVAQWQTHGNPLLIAMLDLDHFKRINDGYGHLAGDKVLKIIADQLSKNLRANDFIARFGGEEFVLLIANTSLVKGLALVEQLRSAIEACPFHFKGERVTITASIGLSAFKGGDRSEAVLKRADEALYRAKSKGRNGIESG